MKYEKPQLANNLRAVSSSKVDSYLQQGLLSEKLILKNYLIYIYTITQTGAEDGYKISFREFKLISRLKKVLIKTKEEFKCFKTSHQKSVAIRDLND